MYLPGTKFYRGAWQETIAAAEAYNDPGRFTAFIGYEWTSLSKRQQPASQRHLPRQRRQGRPGRADDLLSADGKHRSRRPLEVDGCVRKEDGGSVLALAHNGNLSNGEMFPIVEAFGKAIDREYVENAREVGAALRDHPNQR